MSASDAVELTPLRQSGDPRQGLTQKSRRLSRVDELGPQLAERDRKGVEIIDAHAVEATELVGREHPAFDPYVDEVLGNAEGCRDLGGVDAVCKASGPRFDLGARDAHDAPVLHPLQLAGAHHEVHRSGSWRTRNRR